MASTLAHILTTAGVPVDAVDTTRTLLRDRPASPETAIAVCADLCLPDLVPARIPANVHILTGDADRRRVRIRHHPLVGVDPCDPACRFVSCDLDDIEHGTAGLILIDHGLDPDLIDLWQAGRLDEFAVDNPRVVWALITSIVDVTCPAAAAALAAGRLLDDHLRVVAHTQLNTSSGMSH